MEKVTEKMKEALRKPLPSEAVKQHPTKTYLSSIKAIYVVERLNEVFGIGSWKSKVEKESVSNGGMVVVKLIFEIAEYGIYHESYGGNDNGGENSKNFDLGDAFKGATTDALTKICSFLEIGIDVFKGLNDNKPTSSQTKIDVWMTESQFKQVFKDVETAKKAISYYDGKTTQEDGKVYGMKKQYKEELLKIK